MRAAPAGTEVGIYVDLVAPVKVGDLIETRSGRRYAVIAVRVQERGKHAGRQHLRVIVLERGELVPCLGTIRTHPHNVQCLKCGHRGQTCDRSLHRIRWYARKGGSAAAGVGR